MSRFVVPILLAVLLLVGNGRQALADQALCPRPPAGSAVAPPPDLWSQNGVLNVAFDYYTTVDDAGRTLFCFVTPDGLESPTLRVNPGDQLNVAVENLNPPAPAGSPTEVVSNSTNKCGDVTMTITSLNVHYHGTNTSPACHGDQVIHTIINSGETFNYRLTFPSDEPPGLYWYHPHVHGIAEAAVQGGASGVIIVEGIENIQPAVAGLPERVLIIRDMIRTSGPAPDPSKGVASWDASLNYVPITAVYSLHQPPIYTPAVITMQAGAQEFWRVANASADAIIDLQVQYDGKPQTLQVVGLDGVPTGSQDGTRSGRLVNMTDILLAPAARAEFIVSAPGPGVRTASLVTLNVNTGPGGDSDPTRPLASIQTGSEPDALPRIPQPSGPPNPQRFEGLADAQPSVTRTLYFSEVLSNPNDPNSPTNFFITVDDGSTPVLFDPNNPPAIVTTQGAVEDWIIQNRTAENHEFHQHQIHFLLEEVNGVPVSPDQQQFFDMIQVPFWSGKGPYPSVKVRMDFRGPDVGDFVYHCHILAHEDGGMMAIIRVIPPS